MACVNPYPLFDWLPCPQLLNNLCDRHDSSRGASLCQHRVVSLGVSSASDLPCGLAELIWPGPRRASSSLETAPMSHSAHRWGHGMARRQRSHSFSAWLTGRTYVPWRQPWGSLPIWQGPSTTMLSRCAWSRAGTVQLGCNCALSIHLADHQNIPRSAGEASSAHRWGQGGDSTATFTWRIAVSVQLGGAL